MLHIMSKIVPKNVFSFCKRFEQKIQNHGSFKRAVMGIRIYPTWWFGHKHPANYLKFFTKIIMCSFLLYCPQLIFWYTLAQFNKCFKILHISVEVMNSGSGLLALKFPIGQVIGREYLSRNKWSEETVPEGDLNWKLKFKIHTLLRKNSWSIIFSNKTFYLKYISWKKYMIGGA